MEDPRPSELRDPPYTGESVYTRSADRSVPAQYAVFREGAALVDLSKTILRLSGEKVVQMLDAVLTNQVPKEDDLGVYALLLNPKGRIQTDLRILKGGERVLIDVEPEGAPAAKELLGRYAPFYRVVLEDLSETDAPWGIIGLCGPQAGDLLDDLELAEHETAGITLGDAAVLAARGAVPVGLHAYETARVAVGIPRFGSDMTPENFPAEAGVLERAVSFEKGC